MTRFFIVALPRSRTAWLSNLLTYADSFCLHEPLLACRSIAQLGDRLDLCGTHAAGAADTGLPMVMAAVLEHFPQGRYVVLKSDGRAFVNWAKRTGVVSPDQVEAVIDRYATAVELLGSRALSIDVKDLDDADTAAALWGYCGIRAPFNRQRFDQLRDLRVEVMLDRLMGKISANAAGIVELLGSTST